MKRRVLKRIHELTRIMHFKAGGDVYRFKTMCDNIESFETSK